MSRPCKTCKRTNNANEKSYKCVACGCQMHLDPTCTGLSTVAINGIKELGQLAMLLCNTCVENNERDNFIRNRCDLKIEEKLEKLDINEKLNKIENNLAKLVDRKVQEAITRTCQKVEENYATIATKNATKAAIPPGTETKASVIENTHNTERSFRIQGISEDPEKSRNENLIPTNEKVNEVLKCLGVNPQVFEMKRLGKFNKDRTKPRTLLVTLATSHEVRLVLAKSVERRNELKSQNVFISQALSKDEAIKESLCLEKRRELLEEGVPREKLKIRNFELFNNEVKVELETGAPATR